MTTFAFKVTLTESEYSLISRLLEGRIEELKKSKDDMFNELHISSIKNLQERIIDGRILTSWNNFNPPMSDKDEEMLKYLEEEIAKNNKTEK